MPDADADRGRGILSESDRRYLRTGGSNLSAQARYERRNAISDRLRNGLLDFDTLLQHRDRIPDDAETDVSGALAFAFVELLPETNPNKRNANVSDAETVEFMAHVAERAINRAAEAKNHRRRYEVSVEPTERDERSALELELAIRRGEMTPDELVELYESGEVYRDTVVEVLTEVRGDAETPPLRSNLSIEQVIENLASGDDDS